MDEKMLTVAPSSPIVIPAVSAEIAVERWKEYQSLERAILAETDYIYYVTYKNDRGYPEQIACETKAEADEKVKKVHGRVVPRKKKVAFRKLAVFFGLSLPKELTEEEPKIEIQQLGDKFVKVEKRKGSTGTIYMDSGFRVIRAEWTVVVQQVREDGKVFVEQGFGECSNNEKMNLKAHNIISTAYTRALNRGISDLVGFGEVSAEEVDSPEDLDESIIEGKVVAEHKEEKKEEPKPKVEPKPVAKTNGNGNGSDPERAKRLAELAKSAGYNISEEKVRWGLVHLVAPKKLKFGELTAAEEELLTGYLQNQLDVPKEDIKHAKEKGKEVLKLCLERNLNWKAGLETLSHEILMATKENEPVPDMATALQGA